MRILIIGAYGFIGSHVAAGLAARGHTIVAAGRDVAFGRKRFPHFEWVHCDLNKDLTAEAWLPRLANVDIVINAAGILQGSLRDNTSNVHHKGPAALFEACEQAGVKRVIQISALGAGDRTGTAFGRDKASGDTALQIHKLSWVILRPSLIYGRGAFGGTALIRGLAGLPGLMPRLAGDPLFQPIHMDDLAEVVARFCEPEARPRAILNVVGPKEMRLSEITCRVRTWLGFGKAVEVTVPRWILNAGAKIGDAAGWLGSRTSFRTTALKQMDEPNVAPLDPLVKATGFTPRPMAEALAADPAQVQDRWHARLFFLKPLARFVLALFWIVSGLVLLDPISFSYAAGVIIQMGLSDALAGPVAIVGGIIDIALGLLLLLGWRVRSVIAAMILVSLGYMIALTISLPGLWLDALGTLTKIVPIIVFMLMVAAIEDER